MAWVEPYLMYEKHNEYGGGSIIGGSVVNANGYDGSTQIAAVADTGLGGGTAATAHRDIPASRITAIQNFPGATNSCYQTMRGPTDDGRIKPDVVAPGTWILSTYSDMYQQGYDASPNPKNGLYQDRGWGYPLNQYYKYFSGTSMSNPIAAGGATVVRDFYQKTHSLSASAALVKATLINSAVDLLDENNDGINDNDFPIPNVHEGWGQIDLAAATRAMSSAAAARRPHPALPASRARTPSSSSPGAKSQP